MSTLWVRRRFKESRAREAWSLPVFGVFGLGLGAGVFLLVERLAA
jgi:hypothetical protein